MLATYEQKEESHAKHWRKIATSGDEPAWYAGPQANGRFLSIEMCEPKRNTPEADEEFAHVWGATVDLAADICRRYGWSTDVIHSHKWVTETLGGTDHKDPDSYLAEYNRTWDELAADIAGVLSMWRPTRGTDRTNVPDLPLQRQ